MVSDENDHLQVLRFREHPTPHLEHVSSFGRPFRGARPDAASASEGSSEGRGSALGFFSVPTGIAIHDESGLVFISDSKNFRIQTLRLTHDGKLHPVSKFGAGGQFAFKTPPEVRDRPVVLNGNARML